MPTQGTNRTAHCQQFFHQDSCTTRVRPPLRTCPPVSARAEVCDWARPLQKAAYPLVSSRTGGQSGPPSALGHVCPTAVNSSGPDRANDSGRGFLCRLHFCNQEKGLPMLRTRLIVLALLGFVATGWRDHRRADALRPQQHRSSRSAFRCRKPQCQTSPTQWRHWWQKRRPDLHSREGPRGPGTADRPLARGGERRRRYEQRRSGLRARREPQRLLRAFH